MNPSSSEAICFTVSGKPVPQGSMSAFPYMRDNGKMGVRMTHKKASALDKWREEIRNKFIAQNVDGFYAPKGEGVVLTLVFALQRSKSNKDKNPVKKIGDLDKFVRAVNDALTGVAYEDDCQVLEINATKLFTTHDTGPYTTIMINKVL